MIKNVCIALVALAISPSANNLLAQEADRLTVSQWIRPAIAGEFSARVVLPAVLHVEHGVSVIDNAVVTLRGREGIFHQAVADDKGEVSIPFVAAGVYTLTARSPGLSACYAIHVLSVDQLGGDLYPEAIDISLAPIGFSQVAETVRPHLPSDYGIDSLDILEENVEKIVDHVRGNETLSVNRSPAGGLVGFIYQATDHGVVIDPEDIDDRLDPAEATDVFLFKAGERIRRDLTSENGRFELEDLELGVYSLVAVGRDGVAIVGFELTDPRGQSDVTLQSLEGYQFVSAQSTISNDEFAIQVIPLSKAQLAAETGDIGEPCETCEPCEACNPPAAAPASGGGGGGGAGINGGAFAAAAALGAAIGPGSGGGGFLPALPASEDTVGP